VTAGGENVTAGAEYVTAGAEYVTAGGEDVTAGGEDVTAGGEDVTAGAERSGQPKRPLMYASVAGLSGLLKILVVAPYSMSLPGSPTPARLKKAVVSETRAACCMLCVTMTIV
jgi:hypothetical protein